MVYIHDKELQQACGVFLVREFLGGQPPTVSKLTNLHSNKLENKISNANSIMEMMQIGQ